MEDIILRAKSLFDQEEFKQMEQLLDPFWDDKHPEVYYWLGMSLFKQRKIKQSIEVLDLAIALDSGNANWFNDRGIAKFWLGPEANPIEDFDKAVRLQPDYGYRYSIRAFVHQKIGNIEAAIEDYEMAIALDPDDEITQNNLEFARETLKYQASVKSKQEKIRKEKQEFIDNSDMNDAEFLEFERKFMRGISKLEQADSESDNNANSEVQERPEKQHTKLSIPFVVQVFKQLIQNKSERKEFWTWLRKKKSK